MIDLISLQVKLACREAGCPLCRLRRDSERRYLFGFLWENVNDGSIRKHLVRALGFCPDHAWQLQEIEQTRWSDGLGTAVVYEDLTNRALKALQTYRDTLVDRRLSLRERLRRWAGGLADGRGPARHDTASAQGPANLVPRATCRACDIGEDADRRYVAWLVRDCVESADLHEAYQASDGLCLPHLRQALALAEETDPEVARFLVDVAIEHTGNLGEDLSEYIRKHIHEYRREPMSEAQRGSWIRAVAWFAGEKRLTDAEATKVKQGR